ncbi:reprolysin-like metallopeptidase [Flavobacterium sp. GT3R68]|uniref:reprolysin-like metallopeptidase n=1 Tax=Flavobacterium sp. GT3R68 TaxID=2594437 RepID=UPI000F8810E8|nr:zinc-dependent metalloprotease family protein [Flavobacterium sp. GT3R68]RTY90874.1 T9SS sorting signal type C domain-containing protein [Flavobacterium sp. GSN2]TRW93866.1 T9SS sorting signal type C domain-containing protein [Flavobacterium sp. GT3R68]
MNKTLLVFFFILNFIVASAQKNNVWTKATEDEMRSVPKIARSEYPSKYQLFQLDWNAFKSQLTRAPKREELSAISNVIVTFPNPETGHLDSYRILEASIMEQELQASYPEIRSYVGQRIDNPSDVVRFSMSPQKGLSAIIRSATFGTSIIDPYTSDNKNYIIFNKSHSNTNFPFQCATNDAVLEMDALQKSALNNADDNQLRRLRLAMSVTGEYTVFHGGTVAGALAAINATMTRVNGVFENDFNSTMVLIAANANVVYTNAATDPYSPAASMANWNAELQATLTSAIGEANYDVGHLFGATGGGGNAGCIGCVCVNGQKGSGYTSPANGIPQGDTFDIDYVAHELGHQFGANHTFTHSTQTPVAQLEPGSGSTIMGYAGITGATDVQMNSDAYFHAISIQQVTNNIKAKACPVLIATGNATPTANAGPDKILPISTAFKLIGSGTDANGTASLTYCWEQMDIGSATTTYPNGTKTAGPNFRSFTSTSSSMRRLPRLADHVANGVGANMWEIVPGVDRTLNFRLTVRDNRAGGASNESDDMTVFFDNAYGPFSVTSQNTAGGSWTQGTNQTITWTVNNTTALTGSANVNILLSTDGGVTFPITILANTPNDGSQVITVPNVLSTTCRLLIEPTGNDYYAINTMPFAIGYTIATTCNSYTYNTAFAIPDNNTAYTVKSINVPTTGMITDVNLAVNLTHTWISDINIALINPAGTSQINIFNRSCTNDNNINATFDDQGSALVCAATITGNVVPTQALSVYNGINPQGNWLIGVRDLNATDTGSVTSYTLTICSQTTTEIVFACGALTTTWDGSAWSNGVPLKNAYAVINGNYNTATNGSFRACSMTINAGRTLTINPGGYIELDNDLTVNATGVLKVLHEGSLVMLNDTGVVTNNGNIEVYKTTSSYERFDYIYWSSPIVNATIGGIFSSWSLDHAYKFETANYSDLNNDTFDDNQDDWQLVPSATVMTPAKGYIVMTPTSGTFPSISSVMFSGTVNNGVINHPMVLSANGANANDDFNLVGNPYPSAISSNDLINNNLSISGTLYFWTHVTDISSANAGPNLLNYSSNDYAMYNLSGGIKSASNSSVPTGYITSGQGFLVEAIAAGNLTFSNAYRRGTYANNSFFKNSSTAQGFSRDRIWLNMQNATGVFNQQLIGYFDEATAGVDRGYDGLKSSSQNYISFYSIIDNMKYGIQGKGTFDSADTVPLGYFSAMTGTFEIAIDSMEGQFNSADVYLEDKLLQVIHDLKLGPYSFLTETGTFNNRFELRYTNQTLGGSDFDLTNNVVNVNTANQEIAIRSQSDLIQTVRIFDIQGRLIAEKNQVNNKNVILTDIVSSHQLLLIKILLQDGRTVIKKIVF